VRYLSEFFASGETDRSRSVVRLAFSLDAVCCTLGLLLTALASKTAAGLLHLEGREAVIVVVSASVAMAIPVATSRALLGVFAEFTLISRAQIIIAVVRTITVCAVALTGSGLITIVLAITILAVVESSTFVALALRATRKRLGRALMSSSFAPLKGRRRQMLHFVVLTDLSTLLSTATKQVDTLMVGLLAGPREAGYYRLARSLTSPAGKVGGPVQAILYPKLSRAESMGKYAEADAATRRTRLLVCLPLTVAALCAIPLVGPTIVLLAGRDFQRATGPAIALVVGVAVSFATLHVRPVFLARDKLGALLFMTSVPAIVLVVVMVPMADTFGASGVAWARSAAVAIGSLMMILYLRSPAGRHGARPAEQGPHTADRTEQSL